MKISSKILGILFFSSVMFTSCTTEDIDQPETLIAGTEIESMNVDESNLADRISSTQWNVQSKCVSSGNFTTNISGRYKRTNSYIVCNVYGQDKDIKCKRSGNPRTELRGKKEFRPRDNNNQSKPTHAMYVTMKIEKLNVSSGKRVIIGQIFNKTKGDDYGAIYIQNNKLYAIFDGGSKKLLKSSVNQGNTISFSITTNNGTTKISSNGNSKSSSSVKNDICYFKTGAYLISKNNGNRAQVKITKLSQR